MHNAKVISINSLETAKKEIQKIGVDTGALPWLSSKAVHLVIKLENVKAICANIIKQEMLSAGGDAGINKGCVNLSIDFTDIILMGTYAQYVRLIYKLGLQPFGLKDIAKEIEKMIKSVEENT